MAKTGKDMERDSSAWKRLHLEATRRQHRRMMRRMKRDRHIATLAIWKKAQGCSDCGVEDVALDYHHRDPSTKYASICDMACSSLERLIDEIAKCDVLCVSCHRDRHRRVLNG